MISVLCVRRFSIKRDGVASVVEAARVIDLPAVPAHGYLIDFNDGTGAAGVAATRMRASYNRPPGVYPVGLEIKTGTEPGERLESAIAAGWAKIETVAS